MISEVVELMDSCRKEFVVSSQTIHDGLNRVHEQEEYDQFIVTYG